MFWRRLPGAIRGVEAGTPGAAPRCSVCAALTRRLWTLSCSCQVQQRPFSRAPPPEAAETPLITRGRRRHPSARRRTQSSAAERGGARVSVRLAFLSNVKLFTWNQLQGATPRICDETQRPAKPGGGASGGGASGAGPARLTPSTLPTGGSKHWWTGRRPPG